MQMMSRGRLAIVAVVVAFLGVAAWATFRDSSERSGSDTDISAVLERMDAMEARLSAEQEATRRELDALRGRTTSGVTGPGARTPDGPPPSPEQMALEKQKHADAQRRELENLFESQGSAPARDKAPQLLEQAFAFRGVREAFALPESQQVECRATLCLVRAQFPPYKDGSDWANRVLLEIGETLPQARVVTVQLQGGGTELRIYAARSTARDPFGKRSSSAKP